MRKLVVIVIWARVNRARDDFSEELPVREQFLKGCSQPLADGQMHKHHLCIAIAELFEDPEVRWGI